jgi:hypothetical protein
VLDETGLSELFFTVLLLIFDFNVIPDIGLYPDFDDVLALLELLKY